MKERFIREPGEQDKMIGYIRRLTAAVTALLLCMTNIPCVYVSAAGPGKVTGLTIQVTSHPMAELTWDEIDCDGFKVYRDDKAIARVEAGPEDDVVIFTDKEIEPGASYTYSVKAYTMEGGKEVYGAASSAVKIVDGYTYEASDLGGIKLTGYTGQDEKLVVPGTLGGSAVKEIGENCFRGNTWPGMAVISEGIEKIGDYGFECCNLLQKVNMPDSLRIIGDGAFSGCGSLRLADLNDGITSIGRGAFMACTELKQISLPANLQALGKFVFAFCSNLEDVTFDGDEIEEIPERAFDSCTSMRELTLPSSVKTIGKRAFFHCRELEYLSGQISIEKIGDYAFEGSGIRRLSGILNDEASIGFGIFAQNELDEYRDYSFSDMEFQVNIPASADLTEGVFYGSGVNGVALSDSENAKLKMIDGSIYTNDGKTLFVYLPTYLNEDYEYVKTDEAEQKIFHVPEGVTRIAPYAFFECGLEQIYLPSSLREIGDHAFTRSGIAPDLGMVTDYDGNAITPDSGSVSFGGDAFAKWALAEEAGAETTSDTEETTSESPLPGTYNVTSLAGDRSLYKEEDFAGYKDVSGEFTDWCKKYIEDNKTIMQMGKGSQAATYAGLYKSDAHYHQMASVLNQDPEWLTNAYRHSGHEFEEMYLMVDHGVTTELSRAEMTDDLLLYSGITDGFAERIAGVEHGTPLTTDDLINAIGSEYVEKAMISTSASFDISSLFTGDYGVMIFILASKEAMNSLGTYCMDCFMGAQGNGGEEEILFDGGARFKVLDVGEAEKEINGSLRKRTYVMLELLGEEIDPFELIDEEISKYSGWKKENGSWYYYIEDVKQTGWQNIDGKWYYMDSNGVMQTGWVKDNGKWYYLHESGVMAKGWELVNGKWYFLDRSSGAMHTGWLKDNGKWYYLHESGAMAKGWEKVNGKWYFLDRSSGVMHTGWLKDNGKWYYLHDSGAMASGWEKVNGKWYFLNRSSGVMHTGWLKDNGKWYYLNTSGAMVTGRQQIDGTWYTFSANGALAE